jgi:hypothetical protein
VIPMGKVLDEHSKLHVLCRSVNVAFWRKA